IILIFAATSPISIPLIVYIVLQTSFKLSLQFASGFSGIMSESRSFESALGTGVYVTLLPAASTPSDFCSALGAGKLHIAFLNKADSTRGTVFNFL
ncbi:MAG: hypothetical protein QG610_312, partial [Euryarchaeota archaeon]|nr:hypothetical protein [Euryarchaeota archaeon]